MPADCQSLRERATPWRVLDLGIADHEEVITPCATHLMRARWGLPP